MPKGGQASPDKGDRRDSGPLPSGFDVKSDPDHFKPGTGNKVIDFAQDEGALSKKGGNRQPISQAEEGANDLDINRP